MFVFDRITGTTTLVSHVPGSPTTTANGASDSPAISTDGNHVAFVSLASNLVVGQVFSGPNGLQGAGDTGSS